MALKALIFASNYDPYRGVIVYLRIFQGAIKPGDEVRIWSRILSVDEIRSQMDMATDDVVSSVAPHSKLAATWAEIKN